MLEWIGPVGILLVVLGGLNILLQTRRRDGDQPHCRSCNYLLHALQSDRCPECGTELSAPNVARGAPRPWWKALRPRAILIILLGAAILAVWVAQAQNFNWYQYKPTYFVLRDLNSPKALGAQRAWSELVARDSAGSLWPSSRDAMVRFALARQAAAKSPFNPLDTGVVNYLGTRTIAGDLPADQQRTFLYQSARTQVALRARVMQGDSAPSGLIVKSLLPATGNFWAKFSMQELKVDGSTVPLGMGSLECGQMGGAGSFTSTMPSPAVGTHHVIETARVEVFNGPLGDTGRSSRLYVADRQLPADFAVVRRDKGDLIRAVFDPKSEPAVKAAVSPKGFEYSAKSRQLGGEIQFQNPPTDMAFEVWARYAGKEVSLGLVSCRGIAGMSGYSVSNAVDPPPPATIDVILVPSEKAAANTVDLYSYWNEKLEFKNIPVGKR